MENYIIPIDSIFRNHYDYANSNTYTYYLPETLKNLSYIRISSIELPPIYETFNRENKDNLTFEISREVAGSHVTEEVTLTDTTYANIGEIRTDLNANAFVTVMGTLGLTGLTLSLVEVNGVEKVKISANENFSLNFSSSNHPYQYATDVAVHTGINPKDLRNYKLTSNMYYDEASKTIYRTDVSSLVSINGQLSSYLAGDKLTEPILTNNTGNDFMKNNRNFILKNPPLGYYLGFRKKFYTGSNSYIAESAPKLNLSNYIYVKVNNYGNMITNHGDKEYLGKVIVQNATSNTFDDEKNLLSKRFLFEDPEDIKSLKISLHDAFGNLIDLNNQDYSMTLEVGYIKNSDLRNKFREAFL